jgi:hypothetical protein
MPIDKNGADTQNFVFNGVGSSDKVIGYAPSGIELVATALSRESISSTLCLFLADITMLKATVAANHKKVGAREINSCFYLLRAPIGEGGARELDRYIKQNNINVINWDMVTLGVEIYPIEVHVDDGSEFGFLYEQFKVDMGSARAGGVTFLSEVLSGLAEHSVVYEMHDSRPSLESLRLKYALTGATDTSLDFGGVAIGQEGTDIKLLTKLPVLYIGNIRETRLRLGEEVKFKSEYFVNTSLAVKVNRTTLQKVDFGHIKSMVKCRLSGFDIYIEEADQIAETTFIGCKVHIENLKFMELCTFEGCEVMIGEADQIYVNKSAETSFTISNEPRIVKINNFSSMGGDKIIINNKRKL